MKREDTRCFIRGCSNCERYFPMGDLGSLLTIPLTIFLVPWFLRRMPYFRRPDVRARRVAKSRLPQWVSVVEMIFFAASEGLLVILCFLIEGRAHQAIHHGRGILASAPSGASFDVIFWFIQILAPVILTLPLSMLLANFLSWSIPPIRNRENEIISMGVPDYTWHDLNFGLIKACLVILPVCLILMAVSLIQV